MGVGLGRMRAHMLNASSGVLGEVTLPWPSTSMSRQKLWAILVRARVRVRVGVGEGQG